MECDLTYTELKKKGIYHFDVIIQYMNDEVMQNVIAGTVIVKIEDSKISTYEDFCDNICNKLGIVAIMSMAKRIAIEKAQEIEKIINE